MPAISTIPVNLYQPTDPYIHTVDNMPIEGLIERINSINNAVDNNTAILASAIGTQGTLANRLAQSINDDGSLKSVAIDNALHSIEDHLDSADYVRMLYSERAKLSLISPHATALKLQFNTISGAVLFDDATVQVDDSDSISWSYSSGKIKANTAFPSSVRHTHYYGKTPVHQNLVTPNYRNYYTTSLMTSYREGSLRVYINGVRLDPNGSTYVQLGLPSSAAYTAMTYTEGTATGGVVTGGDFVLSTAISSSVRIVIDFDQLY